jgi:hypothetical protein
MNCLPLAAGPGLCLTPTTMSILSPLRIPGRTSTVNLESQPSKSQNPIQTRKKLKAFERLLNEPRLLNTRSGGMYIPPARLRAIQEAVSLDKSSQNSNDFHGMPFANPSLVSSIGSTLPTSSKSYRSCSQRTSFVGGVSS